VSQGVVGVSEDAPGDGRETGGRRVVGDRL